MRLYLGGFYNFYHPQKESWLEIYLPGPLPLLQMLEQQGIPTEEVHLVVINGQVVEAAEAAVSNEDEVRIYPPVGGGTVPIDL